ASLVRSACASILLLALGLAPTPARAESVSQQVERLAGEATTAYHAGEYKKAIELLDRAYQLQPVAALLYNTAKAYERPGEDQKAAEYYTRYAASADVDPKLKPKAEAGAAALSRRPTPPEPPSPPPPPPPAVVEPSPQPPQSPAPALDKGR